MAKKPLPARNAFLEIYMCPYCDTFNLVYWEEEYWCLECTRKNARNRMNYRVNEMDIIIENLRYIGECLAVSSEQFVSALTEIFRRQE